LNALNQFKSDEVLLLTIGNGPIENIDIPNLTLGYLDNPNEMALAYSLADVFVISSLEDNLPNTVLESFACGTPVVGFKVGGIPDMIRDGVNGLLAESKNSQDLAQKIQMLLENDDLRLQMGKNARLIAENEYNLKLQASKYIKLYETIVGKSVS
jgi:glycosyltransferase involved in cell wall biosynthesis